MDVKLGSPAQLPQCFKPTCLSRPHRASGKLHAPWVSELHLLPPAHLRLSHSSFSPLRLQSGCPSPSAPAPTFLSDPVFASFPYCLSQRPDGIRILYQRTLGGNYIRDSNFYVNREWINSRGSLYYVINPRDYLDCNFSRICYHLVHQY